MKPAPPANTWVMARVTEAWRQTLEVDHVDPAQSWEEAGGDSLATLHLLLLLERSFGRRLTFDMLHPQMHIEDLAALVDSLSADAEPAGETGNSAQALPTMHLLPGLHGDEPRLAVFRQALQYAVRFELLEPPGLDAPATVQSDIPALGRWSARRLEQRQPSGPLLLTGFSFGGCVAFEAARALIDAGRRVALLCLLDPPVGAEPLGLPDMTHELRLKPLSRRLRRWAWSWDTGRRLSLQVRHRWRPATVGATERFITFLFREHARRHWHPAFLQVNSLVAVSDQFSPLTRAAWLQLCGGARVVQLPGDHLNIFAPPASDLLMPAYQAAVTAATATL